MVTRSQSTSFGCQGLKEVPSSRLESNGGWFQRVLLKNAKHASAVELSARFLYRFSSPLVEAPGMQHGVGLLRTRC